MRHRILTLKGGEATVWPHHPGPWAALICALLPCMALAGSLRVGPVRLDLSPRHPVAILEVQNTGDTPTLAQVDALDWSQGIRGESLEPSSDLIATPLVMNLAPGETRKVRVGLRERAEFQVERSYRIVVEEVAPAFAASAGLRFAVRISVPVFAVGTERRLIEVAQAEGLSWARRPAGLGCERVLVSNTSDRHAGPAASVTPVSRQAAGRRPRE